MERLYAENRTRDLRGLMERFRAESESAEELTLSHITGAAAVHTLLLRVALATDAAEVLGMVFLTSDEVWFRFRTSYRALYFNGDNIAWIVKHHLHAFVYDANEWLWWAKEAMWDMFID